MHMTKKFAVAGLLASVFALAACDMSTSKDEMDSGDMEDGGMQGGGGMEGGGQQGGGY